VTNPISLPYFLLYLQNFLLVLMVPLPMQHGCLVPLTYETSAVKKKNVITSGRLCFLFREL